MHSSPICALVDRKMKRDMEGFLPRIRLTYDIKFTDPAGIVEPHKVPVKADGWLDISGSIGKSKSPTGLTMLCHPDNPGFPNPWILRASKVYKMLCILTRVRLQYSGIQPTVLQYRLLIHKGRADTRDIKSIYADYMKL